MQKSPQMGIAQANHTRSPTTNLQHSPPRPKSSQVHRSHAGWLLAAGCSLVLLAVACALGTGPSAEQLAQTMVAETASAASPTTANTATLPPTNTALPPTATWTSSPSPTSTITPTPGPVVFSDDFSADRGDWQGCRKCAWDQGSLLMGPYAAASKPEDRLVLCVPCGHAKYFRMSVDVFHVVGETDRGYGLLFWDTDQEFSIYETSPLIPITIAFRYDRATTLFYLLNPNADQIFTGLVKPGKATNRLEIDVEPAGGSNVTVYFKVNNKTAFLLYNRPAIAGNVGLAVDAFAVQVGFDNFKFETVEP